MWIIANCELLFSPWYFSDETTLPKENAENSSFIHTRYFITTNNSRLPTTYNYPNLIQSAFSQDSHDFDDDAGDDVD